jgi:Flp pilus assembly protein TadD
MPKCVRPLAAFTFVLACVCVSQKWRTFGFELAAVGWASPKPAARHAADIALPNVSQFPPVTANTPEAHLGQGYQDLAKERYSEAAREFAQALAENPHLARARYELGVCDVALGRREKAREEFERLLRADPGEPSVIYYLGRLDLIDGQSKAAVRQLHSIARCAPFSDTAYYLGTAYLEEGQLKPAEAWLQQAARLNPRDFRVFDHLARVYQKEDRAEAAEREYARSAELRNHYNKTAAQGIQCSEALEADSLRKARVICQELFQEDDPDRLTTLGMLYGRHGDYGDAVAPLVRAAQLDPDSYEVQHDLGLTYFRLRRFEGARAPLARAVTLRPDFFGSNALLGATLYMLKDDPAAYRVLLHAHQLNPADANTTELLFRTSLFLAHRKLSAGDCHDCLIYLLRAERLRPLVPEVHRYLAQVYEILGENARAQTESLEAQQLLRH